MNRRNVLKGLTAATAGSMGLAFGSGAFTQVEADRNFDVTIAGDDASSQLVIENIGSDLAAIDTTSDGAFTIDATGVQPGALTTFGQFGDVTDATTLEQGTFVVRNENETGESVEITLQLGLTGDLSGSDAVVKLAAAVDPSTENSPVITDDTTTDIVEEPSDDSTVDSLTVPSVIAEDTDSTDAEIECGLVVDTREGGVGEELELTFDVEAERVVQE